MNDNLKPASRNVLLVEGLSDLHFVKQLCNQIAPELEFDIDDKGRLSNLLAAINLEITISPRDNVGILVDADDDLSNRWEEIGEKLRDARVTVPQHPDPHGTIIEANEHHRRVGVWIMPDNQFKGELEDFVIDMIPNQDIVWPKSVDYVDQIPVNNRKFAEGKTDRAKLYAWLSTRKQPPHIGAAIGAGDLNLATMRCQSFVNWLMRLFKHEEQEAT